MNDHGWQQIGVVGQAEFEGLVCGVVQMVGTQVRSRTSSIGAMCRRSSRTNTRMLRFAVTARSLPGDLAEVWRAFGLACVGMQDG